MIKDCRSPEDIDRMLAESREKSVYLFKHSTVCPVSAGARRTIQSFAEEESRASFWQILVRENRDVSLKIAEAMGVEHHSPQVILLKDGRAVWSVSQRAITRQALSRQLDDMSGD